MIRHRSGKSTFRCLALGALAAGVAACASVTSSEGGCVVLHSDRFT
jgi:hypothetical protein